MSKSKVHTVCQLDAEQGNGEKRSKPYSDTAGRASQHVNAVMRQKKHQSDRLWQSAGGFGG